MECYDRDCKKDAVTFHGVNLLTHGYCEEHRCCAKCGLRVNKCDCKSGKHTEREDYLQYKASNNITISKEEYVRLRIADETINLLDIGGIDNWEWYGESLNPDGGESFDDMEERIHKEVFGE